jgi:hypothetical protein
MCGWRRSRANCTTVKPPKFDGATSWAVFHQQFEAAAVQNNWTLNKKPAHLLSVLQGKVADILHTVPAEATYEDIVGALQDNFGDHQLVASHNLRLGHRRVARRCRSSQQPWSSWHTEPLSGFQSPLFRGRPLFHRQCMGPGGEAAPFVGKRPDPK